MCREHGVEIHLNTPVKQLVIENKKVSGVELNNGEQILADETVLNADFGYAMKNLFPPGTLKKYTPEKVDSKKNSYSTFMLHLGLDKIYDLPHHTLFFAEYYKRNVSRYL